MQPKKNFPVSCGIERVNCIETGETTPSILQKIIPQTQSDRAFENGEIEGAIEGCPVAEAFPQVEACFHPLQKTNTHTGLQKQPLIDAVFLVKRQVNFPSGGRFVSSRTVLEVAFDVYFAAM